MTALIPTVHGKGPYRPVVSYNHRLYVIGNAFDTIEAALAEATQAIEAIRDSQRSPGFDEILADLP